MTRSRLVGLVVGAAALLAVTIAARPSWADCCGCNVSGFFSTCFTTQSAAQAGCPDQGAINCSFSQFGPATCGEGVWSFCETIISPPPLNPAPAMSHSMLIVATLLVGVAGFVLVRRRLSAQR